MALDSAKSACFAITGPTACGKTDLALELAREFPVEIVSMDSALVYRGMDIGTAKPDRSLREQIPHHLIDILDPEQSYSAGQFVSDATALVEEIASRGRLALLVGGTMLYLKALRDGLSPLPERNPAVRASISVRADSMGWPALHEELAAIDPDAADRIEPTDPQRIQRALEVHAVTGRTLTEIHREPPSPGLPVESFALVPADRARLGKAIERRFDAMIERGFIDEVRQLRDRPGLHADSPAMRAVGYRQAWAYLDGRCTWPEAAERAIVATRQLAKRQLTWLRSDTKTLKMELDDPGLLQNLRQRVCQRVDSG